MQNDHEMGTTKNYTHIFAKSFDSRVASIVACMFLQVFSATTLAGTDKCKNVLSSENKAQLVKSSRKEIDSKSAAEDVKLTDANSRLLEARALLNKVAVIRDIRLSKRRSFRVMINSSVFEVKASKLPRTMVEGFLRTLQEVAESFPEEFKLPKEIRLVVNDEEISHFVPSAWTIRIPRELATVENVQSRSVRLKMIEAILSHEFAHALFEANLVSTIGRVAPKSRLFADLHLNEINRISELKTISEIIDDNLGVFPSSESARARDLVEHLETSAHQAAKESITPKLISVQKLSQDVILPYNEVFADTLAVIRSGDPHAISKALSYMDIDNSKVITRMFDANAEFTLQQLRSSPHTQLAPFRGWLFSKHLQDGSLAIKQKPLIIRSLMGAIAKEVSALYEQFVSANSETKEKILNDVIAKNESLKSAFERELLRSVSKR